MTKDKLKGKLLTLKLKSELLKDISKRTSRLLMYIGSANLVFGLLQAPTFISGVFIACTSLVIVMLGFLSRNNTMVPLIIAFILLLASYIIDFINMENIGLLGGMLRLVLLGFLASGIYHCLAADRILSKYDNLDRPVQE